MNKGPQEKEKKAKSLKKSKSNEKEVAKEKPAKAKKDKEKQPKQKKEKPEGQPKKPQTAYFLFCADKRAVLNQNVVCTAAHLAAHHKSAVTVINRIVLGDDVLARSVALASLGIFS